MQREEGQQNLRAVKNGDESRKSQEGRYNRAFNSYVRTQLRQVTPILRVVARECQIGFKYPVFKVMKAVAKLFLLNQIEAMFFAYVIAESKWDIHDRLILKNCDQVRDLVTFSSDSSQFRGLILYLMLVTYGLKYYLNESTTDLLEEANRICPNFLYIFQNWVKKHPYFSKKFAIKKLNNIYCRLSFALRKEEPDYNIMVDSILQISPAYNPQKSAKDKRFQRRARKQTVESSPAQGNELHPPPTQSLLAFTNSGLDQMAPPQNDLPQQQFVNPFESSVLRGFPAVRGVQAESEGSECLDIGLRDGQSEQNMIMADEILVPVVERSRSSAYFGDQKYLDSSRRNQ